ncbi:four helix bundle protein [Aliifodinibius salipaludis]|nr:four helix bundle protein [Aliifodinibius salipaludis]
MRKNIIKEKSYEFALEIVQLSKVLNKSHQFVLSRQILKSGTSIGANVEEGIGGQSKKDFRAKMSIAYKEARETHYWLRLLKDSDLIPAKHGNKLIGECHELKSILGAILVSLNKSIGN